MHSPELLTLPLMVQSGDGATGPEADASRMAWALSGALAAARITVFLLRTRQSPRAVKAAFHTPALGRSPAVGGGGGGALGGRQSPRFSCPGPASPTAR